MTKTINIELPKLGESIVSATVVSWLKKEGEMISKDEPLVEVSTDKVNSEIPSPAAGILKKQLANEGEEIEVGAGLAILEVEQLEAAKITSEGPRSSDSCSQQTAQNKETFLSPAVLGLARSCNISLEELTKIKGSGSNGRVTRRDVQAYVEALKPSASSNAEHSAAGSSAKIERLEMNSMRRAIADNMVRSFYEAPHASLVSEVDVTKLVKYIKKHKQQFLDTHGVKLTITSYIVDSLTKAALAYPMVNASLEDNTIVMKRYVHLGIAVSVEKGVVVPVIQNCHEKDIPEIAKEVARLSGQARGNKLSLADLGEGTITMTNFGMSGAMIGIPIIRYPEVAIVGIGAIQKKVAVVDEDQIAIRDRMHVTLTFDHRIIDGIYGANFLNYFKSLLEDIPLE